ncbi:MAG: hypothetical protein RIM83_03570 [Allomuricauda sp.]
MKKLPFLLLLIIVFSCQDSQGQQKYDTIIKEYNKKNVYGLNKNRVFVSYYFLGKDTVLSIREKHIYLKAPVELDEEYITSQKQKKKIEVSESSFIYLSDRNEIFLLNKTNSKYQFLGSIDSIKDLYKIDGIAAMDIYKTSDIVKHIKSNYLIIFTSEGNYKVGIFEITEEGITQKFLSKGCLFYEDWYEWDSFYEIKEGRIFLNYLIDPNKDEVGQVELKYENGQYSLDLNQCE